MKRNILLLTAISVSTILASCGGGETTSTEETTANEATAAAEKGLWTVDPSATTIRWEGGTAGAQVYSHYGIIKVKEGKLETEGQSIVGGSFIIDMTSINPTDENYSEEHPASDLVAHLGSDDFFSIEQHPTASFNVKSVSGNTITGDLTVRGKTNEETINIESVEMVDGTMTAKGRLVFDRQKYDVAWAHYLQDVVLSDDITLDITLKAKKA